MKLISGSNAVMYCDDRWSVYIYFGGVFQL